MAAHVVRELGPDIEARRALSGLEARSYDVLRLLAARLGLVEYL